MKLLKFLLTILKSQKQESERQKTLEDYKQEVLVQQGREQFKRLLEKGLGIPVALL